MKLQPTAMWKGTHRQKLSSRHQENVELLDQLVYGSLDNKAVMFGTPTGVARDAGLSSVTRASGASEGMAIVGANLTSWFFGAGYANW